MTNVKGGLTVLRELMESLPTSEKKVATYIITYPEEAVLLTAKTLGEKSATSSAAVMRLCKSLGFSGFQELKVRVAADLQSNMDAKEYVDIAPNEAYVDIIHKMTVNTIQTLKETAEIIQTSDVKKAVDVLKQASSIIFIGFGASQIAAQDAALKFTRIDKNVQCYQDVHMAATAIATKGRNDVVVGISFSGETKEVVKLMQLAKNKQVNTISLTKYGPSSLAQIADISLHTSTSNEAMLRSGATSSRIAQLHILDILFTCLASEEYEAVLQYLDETREAIRFLQEN